ncbi:MAG: PepSY domain-containing protein, partial [Acidobacteria bacterium]
MARVVGWLRHPQGVWLRKALFQIHLWTALGIGLYLVVISVTGSVLVYRSEL